MFILFLIPGNLLLFLAALMLIGSIVFAIWYIITQAKEENKYEYLNEMTKGKRSALLLAVLGIFVSICAFIYGLINHEAVAGVVGVLVWMILSTVVAYTCSPLRLIYADNQRNQNQGCVFILYTPLLAILSVVSMILIMLISWIFGLAAVLKGLSKKVYVIIAVIIVIIALLGVGLNLYQQNENNKDYEQKGFLVEEAMGQVISDIEKAEIKKITFDEETKLAMEEFGIKSFFTVTEVREAAANKFSNFYKTDDLDSLLEFLFFLNANHGNLISKEDVYDICFTESYINELKKTVKKYGEFKELNGENEIYTYKDSEFWFIPNGCYVDFKYTLNDETKSGSVILGYTHYRKNQHEDYDESSPGYFLVEGNIEIIEDKIENSEDLANKFYPAATCPKCGNSFRANTMRAMMIADHGYCGMGLCSKDD